MSKKFKKVTAIILGTTMLLAQSIPALAADPTTEAGEGNILAYSVDTYVVPTSISVALNPQGYDVQLRDGEADTDKTDAQIVSLNYAIANLSSSDKVFNVSIEVTGGTEITFVESADDISDTAAPEIYLALVANTGDITTGDGDDFEVDDKTGDNEHNVTAANLTDVIMTADATTAVAFGGESAIIAEKSFDLGKASYGVKDGATVDFDTTQEALADLMEITEVGGIKGFTLTGAMNEAQDWTKLEAKKLTFTPTYEFLDADEAAAVTELTATYDSANTRYVFTLPEDVTIENVSEVTNVKVNGNAVATIAKNAAGTEVRIARSDVKAAIGETDWATTTDLEFTFRIGGVNYSASSTK